MVTLLFYARKRKNTFTISREQFLLVTGHFMWCFMIQIKKYIPMFTKHGGGEVRALLTFADKGEGMGHKY